MYGLLRCKEGNSVCNLPYRYPVVLAAFQFMVVRGLKGIMHLSVSELSLLIYYIQGQSTELKILWNRIFEDGHTRNRIAQRVKSVLE